MRTHSVLLLIAVLIVGTLPAGASIAQADDFVAVSTTVSPDDPVPGEPFTIEATITNAADSETQQIVKKLELRNGTATDSDLISERSLERRLDPATRTTLPISATINESGSRELYLHIRFLGGERIIQPVTVDINQPHPQVELSVADANPGEARTMTVSVSNGMEQTIRNVELVVAGERFTLDSNRRIAAGIESGGTRRFEFSATPEAATELPADVTVRYSVGNERREVTRSLQADFANDSEPAEHPRLAISVQDAIPGASRAVNVTVANGLEEDVRQVTVTVRSRNVDFETNERVQARLAAGQTVSFSFSAAVAETGDYPVSVALTYTRDGVRERITRRFDASFDGPANPGEVRLTGVDAVQTGQTLEISATASNVGSTSVEAVVVQVAGDALRPADYFVGSIEASDFASFTLNTRLEGDRNVSTVPIEITYVVDGVTRSTSVSVPVDRRAPADVARGGGLPLLPALLVVGLLVITGVVIYRRWG